MKNILIIIIAFQLYSCDKENYSYIAQDQKPILQNEDTVCFINNENAIDSFVIKRRDYFEVFDKVNYLENIDVRYLKINERSTFTDFFIQQGLSSSSISIDGSYFEPTWANKETIDLNINEVVYHSVYFMHSDQFSDSIPSTIYYSYKYGILRYDYPDNTCFELKNN